MNSIEKYNKLFKKLFKLNTNAYGDNTGDNEMSHILQDKIYRKFVKDIASNKIKKIEDIQEIASLINKHVIKYDKGRWYA